MSAETSRQATAFLGGRRIAHGDEATLRLALESLPATERARTIVIDDATGGTVDAWSGDAPTEPPARRRRGRPKLGVAAREVTLLPRHWEWLAAQPGGASAALRRLVEDARYDPATLRREAQALAQRALTTLAGDLDGYEGALRALYAGDDMRFSIATQKWPEDLRTYLAALAAKTWAPPAD